MVVSLYYKFTEGVITRLIILLDGHYSLPLWFLYFLLFLTGNPPAATCIKVTSVAACLTWRGVQLHKCWGCSFPASFPTFECHPQHAWDLTKCMRLDKMGWHQLWAMPQCSNISPITRPNYRQKWVSNSFMVIWCLFSFWGKWSENCLCGLLPLIAM